MFSDIDLSGGEIRAFVLIAAAFGIALLVWFLAAMGRREWVKTDLCERGCSPLSIQWAPLAFRAPPSQGPAFKVAYTDALGLPHKAWCYTSNVQWRKVVWIKDQVSER